MTKATEKLPETFEYPIIAFVTRDWSECHCLLKIKKAQTGLYRCFFGNTHKGYGQLVKAGFTVQ